jgi:hypothetical protein
MRASCLVLELVLVVSAVFSGLAAAADVQIYDRATGQVLPTYRHHGRAYVAGEPGHEYEIRINNPSSGRVLAVTTVDGANVVSGQTGAVNQGGYVLDSYGFLRIEGWRKSMERTAAFYFTNLADSYAARTGRPDNVGVIGIALFNEKIYCCRDRDEDYVRRDQLGSAAEQRAQGPATDELAKRRAAAPETESKLGTGHGRSEHSPAQYADFERASSRPEETVVIYYDSQRNLLAQGVIPKPRDVYARRLPQPFPGFVPDP